jgi:hypothetical protein
MLEALNKQTIQAEKRRKGNLIIMAHSVCLEQGLLDESMLPALKVVVPLLKIVLFLCFQISQAPNMKISMKKGLSNWHLVFSISSRICPSDPSIAN